MSAGPTIGARLSAALRRCTLRDVLVFTVPPLALAIGLFVAATMDYRRIRQYDDWWSNATSVRKFGWLRARTALRTPRLIQAEKHLSAEAEDVPLLRLLVDRADWNRIDEDVGGRWGEWIPAQVLAGAQLKDVELRFRGDGSAHWTTPKKSFTLKTRRNDLLAGFRTLAFSVKDVLPQWLAAELASEFDLLAPEQQLVPVYLNDRFYGLHRFIEPIDEAFLRRHGRIPGHVFRADTAERGDAYKGLQREVFANPHIWDLAAEGSGDGAPGRDALERFLADLNGSTQEARERFAASLDLPEISRLFAYLLVVGDPFHMSGVHNQFWYLDPAGGTFRPVPWDVRLLELGKPPRESNYNRFWRSALAEPRIWDGALRELARALEGDGLVQRAERRVTEAWEAHRHAFEYDALRSGVIPPVGEPETALATLRANVATLREWLSDARVSAAAVADDSLEQLLVVDVVVRGLAPVEVRVLGNPDEPPPTVLADVDGDGVESAGDRALGATRELGRLLPRIEVERDQLRSAPVRYRFFLRRGADGPALDELAVLARNALSGAEVAVEPLAAGAPLPAAAAAGAWELEKSAPEPLVLSGEVRVTEDLVLDEDGAAKIEPGTTFVLSPGVSWLSRGRVEALGTAERPITFRAETPGRPWGVLALQGRGASGSRFEHVRFEGGGGATLGAVRYEGMVCVHEASKVEFRECEFASNRRCDDALHAASSEVRVVASRFLDVNADAIDFDRCRGAIEGCRIEAAPEDGIELSCGTPARVADNDLLGVGGRALTIAERSDALVLDNRILDCGVGIEVRDGSEPVLAGNRIERCATAVHALRRNRSYELGGWPKTGAVTLADNGTDWLDENDSRRTRIDAAALAPGLGWLASWNGSATGAATLVDRQDFDEGFRGLRGGWISDGRASRVRVAGEDLEIVLGRGPAHAALPREWDLSDPTLEHVLVLEVGGENVASLEVSVRSPAGDVAAAVALDDDPDTFVHAAVELPPGRYEGLVIAATPASTRSSVRLHAWRLFSRPARSQAR